jgi:cell division protein FtsL
MSIDVEYAIKKDIRNNPVVREVDVEQKREFFRAVGLAVMIVGMLLFSAWQRFEVMQSGYQIERLDQARDVEESLNRQLRLEVETWRAPQAIEQRAMRELHMVQPSPAETIVVERAPAPAGAKAIVAENR